MAGNSSSRILVGIPVVNADDFTFFAYYSNFAWLIIFWCKYVHYIHYRKPVFCNKTILLLSMKKSTYRVHSLLMMHCPEAYWKPPDTGRGGFCQISEFILLVYKSVNLQYNTLGCLDDGTNELSTKYLIFFFSWFLAKSFQFIFLFFYKITKIKIKCFECPKSMKGIKKIILGTSDSWSTIRLSHRPSNPA